MACILICIHDAGGVDSDIFVQRAATLRTQLGTGRTVEIRPVHIDDIAALATDPCEVLVAVGFGPTEVANFGLLARPCIWDFGLTSEDQVAAWLENDADRAALQHALVAVRSICDMDRATALRLEDALTIGITPQSVEQAVSACIASVAIVLGAGLGNMIYGTGMVRWISERLGAPVDLIIHDRFDQALALFANAPCLNTVYSGFDYIAGRHYKTLISSITAGGTRSLVSADRTLWLEQDHSYNEEGRFLPEPNVNFLGLDALFGKDPVITAEIPMPFLRDIAYTPPGERIIGITHGKKTGAWAKREWPHMETFVQRLVAEGWTVRSFGLPAEYVEGAEDYTHLSMRDCVYEIANCDYFISHDGGMCHIAEGLGVPTIWLFGATGSAKNGPVYAHSRTLNTMLECGPCMYKAEWLRCETPACMSGIEIEQVLKTLETLHSEISEHGYNPQPLPMDDGLLRYEIQALYKPGPQDGRALAEAERLIAFPSGLPFRLKFALSLLKAGDIGGLAQHIALLGRLAPNNPIVRLLNGIVAQTYDYPVGFDANAALKPLTPACNAELVAELERLPLNQEMTRFVTEAGLRYWFQERSNAGAISFVETLLGSIHFSQNFQRALQRFLERLLPEDGGQIAANTQFYRVPSLNRMRRVLMSSPETLLRNRAQKIAEDMAEPDMSAERVYEARFAPHFLSADVSRLPPVLFELNGKVHKLPPHSTVLMLVPHVKMKDEAVGSTSGVIIQHAERLVALGLRPVVISPGFDDVPSIIEMRNSITYMQAHRRWPKAYWEEIRAYFGPKLVLAYSGVEQMLPLGAAFKKAAQPVSISGLSDTMGFAHEFERPNSWGMGGPVPGAETNARSIEANTLSDQMFLAPVTQKRLSKNRPEVLVLVIEPSDFMHVTELAAAMPSVTFTVASGFIHRGIEKNLKCIPLQSLSAGQIAKADCLMQFSIRHQTLAANALARVETGDCVIAPLDPATAPRLAKSVVNVNEPERLGAWIEALTTMLRNEMELAV